MFSSEKASTSTTTGFNPAAVTRLVYSASLSFLTATSNTSIWSLPPEDSPGSPSRMWKSIFTSLMSNGIYCSASHLIDSSNSSSVIAGMLTFLTITAWPETERATFFSFTCCSATSSRIAATTRSASTTVPSTINSGPSALTPNLTSRYPLPFFLSCTSLIDAEPMSRPNSSLLFMNGKSISITR